MSSGTVAIVAYICWVLTVVAGFICFTMLAIHFDHWWIGLFGLIGTLSVPSYRREQNKTGGSNE